MQGRRGNLATMFVVTEVQAAMIRTAYEQGGEFSAAVELRQLFPGITDTALARDCVRTSAFFSSSSKPSWANTSPGFWPTKSSSICSVTDWVSGSWMRQEILQQLRHRCQRLCPMRLGHACDNCRHIEFHLPAVGIISGNWRPVPSNVCALSTSDRCNESKRTDECSRKDPLT
jgi:hypothetical protein